MYCSEFHKGGFMGKLILPRGLILGDEIYLTLGGGVWLKQSNEKTHCLDHCYQSEDFFDIARLIAQGHKFGIKEIEIPEIAVVAYEFVRLEEEEEAETEAKAVLVQKRIIG